MRIAVVAATLVACIGLAHGAARPAAATDCQTYYCAYITFTASGNGYAHITDDQGVLDCYYNAGSYSGACTNVEYYWIGQMYPNGQLPVTVTIMPQSSSYVCNGFCGQLGQASTDQLTLSRDDHQPISATVSLANVLSITVSVSGDGSGSVTSSPAGLDCRYASGGSSGTCSHDFLFSTGISVTVTGSADAGSTACHLAPGGDQCSSVGGTTAIMEGTSGTAATSLDFSFHKAHPIVSVAVNGQGTVVSSPAGISCGTSCSSYFPPNTNVTLSAAAKTGQVLTGWTGACQGFGTTCNLSLGTTDVSTTALFAAVATPTPAPGATPHPMPTPTHGIPAPSGAVAGATPQGSLAPGAGDVAGSSAPGMPAPDSSAVAGGPGSAAPTDGLPGQASMSASGMPAVRTVDPASSGVAGGGIDPLIIVLIALGAVVILLVGILAGVFAGRRRRPSAGDGGS